MRIEIEPRNLQPTGSQSIEKSTGSTGRLENLLHGDLGKLLETAREKMKLGFPV
jgi:hypothetical protein